jgi:protein-tyrosine phosphatase
MLQAGGICYHAAVAETRVITVDPETFDPSALDLAAQALRDGGIVALPTETVYGLAVNLEKPDAVRRLLELRGSPADKRITVHIGDRDELRRVVPGPLPPAAARLIQKFWPGPLTIIFPTPDGRGVGVRYPNHKVARELLRRAGVRAGAPSANLAGQAPAVTGQEVVRAFGGKVDVIVDAGPTRQRGASTVVRAEGSRVEVLREGAIPRSMIEEANLVTVLFVCTGNTCRSPMAAALFRRLLADRLKVKEGDLAGRGYRVISAGTAAGYGGAATEEAEQAVKKYGADLSDHSSQPVSVTMLEEADRVFVMTQRHKRVLTEWVPEHADKIDLLDPDGREVDDPIGASAEVYRECARQLYEALGRRIKEIP